MNAKDLLRSKQLFLAASDLPPRKRGPFLDSQENMTAELRQAVEQQLGLLDARGDSLVSPAVSRFAVADPTELGPFKVVRRIGEGGMGVVYLCEQEKPIARRVAIKRIRAGMDSEAMLRRFEAERSALERMDHPAIARILDAGVDAEGRPYFAMEFVDGEPLLAFCDNHQLNPGARLRLFVEICRGVQHAHQKGVLHRDLSSNNVLVTLVDGQPAPKIIDFGLAKAMQSQLTLQSLHTQLGSMMGTPDYMSPEQADAGTDDVDTRSDVYSLGVMLYELLTGQLPFEPSYLREQGLLGIRRVLQNERPLQPSVRVSKTRLRAAEIARVRGRTPASLVQRLRGDLDWIVMHALEKQREDRYGSAEELAADALRHLADEPVLAGPPTMGYRIRKFVKRNRIAVAMASLVGVLVLAGVGTSAWFASETRVQRRLTASEQEKAQLARASTSSLMRLVAINDPYSTVDPGLNQRDALDDCARAITAAFEGDPLEEARARTTLGGAYWTIGALDAAEAQLVRARQIHLDHPGVGLEDLRATLWPLAWTAYYRGRAVLTASWTAMQDSAVDATADGDATITRRLQDAFWSQFDLALDDDDVLELVQSVHRELDATCPENEARWLAFGDYLVVLGDRAGRSRRPELNRAVLELAESVYLDRARIGGAKLRIATAREMRLDALYRTEDFDRGFEMAEETLNEFSMLLPKGHWYMAVFRGWRGVARLRRGDPTGALEDLRPSFDTLHRVLGRNHIITGHVLMGLVEAELEVGDEIDAEAHRAELAAVVAIGLEDAVENPRLFTVSLGREHQDLAELLLALWRIRGQRPTPENRAIARVKLAELIVAAEDLDRDRKAVIANFVLYWIRAHRDDGMSHDPLALVDFAVAALAGGGMNNYGQALFQLSVLQGQDPQASELALATGYRSLSCRNDAVHGPDSDGSLRIVLAKHLLALGRTSEALDMAQRGYAKLWRVALRGGDTRFGLMRIAVCLDALGRSREITVLSRERLRVLLTGGASVADLNTTCWHLAKFRGLNSEDYDLALRGMTRARASMRAMEERGLLNERNAMGWLNTVGLVQYRAGEYESAVKTFDEIMTRSGGESESAVDHAFLAMSHFRLGNEDDARSHSALALELWSRVKLDEDSEDAMFRSELIECMSTITPSGPR